MPGEKKPHGVGVTIRAARKRAGLTQDQLARRMGVSQATLSLAEQSGANISKDWLDNALRQCKAKSGPKAKKKVPAAAKKRKAADAAIAGAKKARKAKKVAAKAKPKTAKAKTAKAKSAPASTKAKPKTAKTKAAKAKAKPTAPAETSAGKPSNSVTETAAPAPVAQ